MGIGGGQAVQTLPSWTSLATVPHLTEIAAFAGIFLGLVAIVLAIVLGVKLRRLSAAHRVVLGPDGQRDLVSHAAGLQGAFEQLATQVDESAIGMENHLSRLEHQMRNALSSFALVRYDAYGEMSGQQSASLALLDANRNGVVLTSIAHRDTARLYCRQVVAGQGEHELSPEEDEAIAQASQRHTSVASGC